MVDRKRARCVSAGIPEYSRPGKRHAEKSPTLLVAVDAIDDVWQLKHYNPYKRRPQLRFMSVQEI